MLVALLKIARNPPLKIRYLRSAPITAPVYNFSVSILDLFSPSPHLQNFLIYIFFILSDCYESWHTE